MEQQKQKCVAENAESKNIVIISRKEAQAKGIKRYFTGKPCKYGHVDERNTANGICVVCQRLTVSKHRSKNIEKYREKDKKRYRNNLKSEKLRSKEYYYKNKEKCLQSQKEWRKNNKDAYMNSIQAWKINNKEKSLKHKREEYQRNKERYRDSSKKWRLENREQQFARNSIKRLLNNWKGKRKDAEAILGYTLQELRESMQSKFTEGMSWDNYGYYGWHIDHIKPVSIFISEGITDPKIINALDNLQPLWAKDNLEKGVKYERPV